MTEAPQVYQAISSVMAHMAKEGIAKSRNNEQQRYKFRGIDDVYNALASVLAANKLVMLPFVQDIRREERATKSGGALNYTILTVDFTLVSAVDGSQCIIRMIGEAMDSADKSANKAMSAALKYAALEVFMIPTEGDNDADATTYEVVGQAFVSEDQVMTLHALAEDVGADVPKFCAYLKVKTLSAIPAAKYSQAVSALEAKRTKVAA